MRPIVPVSLAYRHSACLIPDQHRVDYQPHIELIVYLQSLGQKLPPKLASVIGRPSSDFYHRLLSVRTILETGEESGNLGVVHDFVLSVLGEHYRSQEIVEVDRWVRLLTEIKHLLSNESLKVKDQDY